MRLVTYILMAAIFVSCKQHGDKAKLSDDAANGEQRIALLALIESTTNKRAMVDDELTPAECDQFTAFFNDKSFQAVDFEEFAIIHVESKAKGVQRTSLSSSLELISEGRETYTDSVLSLYLSLNDLPSVDAFQRRVKFMNGAAKFVRGLAPTYAPLLSKQYGNVLFGLAGIGEKYGVEAFPTPESVAEMLKDLDTSVTAPLKTLVTQTMPASNLSKLKSFKASSELMIELVPRKVPWHAIGYLSEDDAKAESDLWLELAWNLQQLNDYVARLEAHLAKGNALMREIRESTGRSAEKAFTDFADETIARLTTLSTTLKDIKPLVNKRLGPDRLSFTVYGAEAGADPYRSSGGPHSDGSRLNISADDMAPAVIPGFFGGFVEMVERQANTSAYKLTFSTWNYGKNVSLAVCAMPANPPHTCVGAPLLAKADILISPKRLSRGLWPADKPIDLAATPNILIEVSDAKRQLVRQGFSFKK